MTPSYEDLQAQNAWLKEQLDGVTGSTNYQTELRHAFGLSPKQAGILAVLMNAKRPVTTTTMYSLVYEHENGEGPDHPIVKVGISQLRRRLRAFRAPEGVTNAWGTGGYTITPELRAWVSDRVAA